MRSLSKRLRGSMLLFSVFLDREFDMAEVLENRISGAIRAHIQSIFKSDIVLENHVQDAKHPSKNFVLVQQPVIFVQSVKYELSNNADSKIA
jgi:hypothetical protein